MVIGLQGVEEGEREIKIIEITKGYKEFTYIK